MQSLNKMHLKILFLFLRDDEKIKFIPRLEMIKFIKNGLL